MNRGKQLSHGAHLDLDAYIANGSMKLVKSQHAFDFHTGEPVPVSPKTLSIITPLNKPHWKKWTEPAHPDSVKHLRDNWHTYQHLPDVQYKIDQIKKSCPECTPQQEDK